MDKPNRAPSTSLLLLHLEGGSHFGKEIAISAIVKAVYEHGAGVVYHVFLTSHFG